MKDVLVFDYLGNGAPDVDTGFLDTDVSASPYKVRRDYRPPCTRSHPAEALIDLPDGRWVRRDDTYNGLTFRVWAKYDSRQKIRILQIRVFRAGTQEKIATEIYPARKRRSPKK